MSNNAPVLATPEFLATDVPRWFYQAGATVCVQSFLQDKKILKIGSDTIEIQILPMKGKTGIWCVRWKVFHAPSEYTEGARVFDPPMLQRAFWLQSGEAPPWTAGRYPCDDAVLGHFIRKGNHLNIPGPGTGLEGNANASLLLTKEIQDCIVTMLAPPTPPK
jgi:hypothetical protein